MTDIIKDPALDFNGFCNQMRQKLQRAQDLGKSGWDTCPASNLYSGLRKALMEGRFVDAANYSLFLQRRAAEGVQFLELENLTSICDQSTVKDDTIRLANVTIAQHEETIRALREGENPMQGRRNDELLNAALINGASWQSAQIVGEVAELKSSAKGYITVTRVGKEVTTTAEVEGDEQTVASVLTQIAYGLGNEPAVENYDVDCEDDAIRLDTSNERNR